LSRLETFFVTCAPGIEPTLHAEMRALRFGRVERQVGGVRFEGTLADAWRANLWLRTAVRVLLRVSRFEARDADQLYKGVQEVEWSRFLRSNGTFVVDAHSSESALDHTLFIEQRVKDSVADQFRAANGARPSVAKDDPDLSLHVHLFKDRCTLSADTSGESLHKRGWRKFQGRAPLAETLAAALVLESGWDRRSPIVDPFCGSGTILIEAALIAANVAPGLFRERFAFERWPGHDEAAWKRFCESVRAEAYSPSKSSSDRGTIPSPRLKSPPRSALLGFDASADTISGAIENVRSAGLDGCIEITTQRAEDFAPKRGWNAWIITNPPYGERVGEERDLLSLYQRFGRTLREQAAGYHVALLSGNLSLTRALGISPERRIAWKNGAIDCECLLFDLNDRSLDVESAAR
jgi:23S rRNA (guanine2445-N2)-methyltransferase / 23S rRNA (guanine2069-N7)-methyltransferase